MPLDERTQKVYNLYMRGSTEGERQAAYEALKRMNFDFSGARPGTPPQMTSIDYYYKYGCVVTDNWQTFDKIYDRTRDTQKSLRNNGFNIGTHKLTTNELLHRKLRNLYNDGLIEQSFIYGTFVTIFRIKNATN